MLRINSKSLLPLIQSRFNSTKAYDAILTQFKTDLKKAMIAKDVVKKDTIRNLMSTIKNEEINGVEKNEYELFRLFNKLKKQREDSVAEYEKLKRSDLAERESLEAQVIDTYIKSLPVASEEDTITNVENWLKEQLKDGVVPIGKIMANVNDELAETWQTSTKQIKAIIGKYYKNLPK